MRWRPGLHARRTLNDSFVILDEAQNTTTDADEACSSTRGCGLRVQGRGHRRCPQIDLPAGKPSGHERGAGRSCGEVEGIRFIEFTDRDVVRHPLVQEVVRAYDSRGEEMT